MTSNQTVIQVDADDKVIVLHDRDGVTLCVSNAFPDQAEVTLTPNQANALANALRHDSQSTPITAEGLRGLGFEYIAEGHYARCWRMLSPMGSNGKLTLVEFPHVWVASLTDFAEGWTLGDAPDLETVADLIDVLKRMNGGGMC